ncbi:UNVERIFIED_ORG: glycosyl transferase [Clostridium botulinum]|uniref:Glycosyltransferase n=1 Tax=Clostridium botulinum TaxID=1491 RepID=A0A6B4R3P9_CLOBO|nr:glycosyltransferase [Clostridium botulinum]ACD53270.1 glycosyltransferase involved in cell wall biogenesis [Clostridium botulinum E3 str. Alaska E43]AJF30741.1 glycosyl transferase [Clostridium botulinum]AJF33804.1 glycosyl transferase [Clostridium botulinum]EES49215.1 glycosyltransferase involved in cell wall biogenesis [Clostridium botulinum E1 str. 'BoNT E Beluga']MBN1072317.1 glycosyltransferase [Clostridium botulinum]
MFKVSIITPVYNVEECIEKSIKSVINQTCKEFEFLLIDDGSKDRSIEIAKSLLEGSDINFKIITQENAGVSCARNRGINIASGEYITFLDSDDYIDSRFVELMYEKAKQTECDVVFCDYSEVDSNGNVLVKNRTNYLNDFISGKEAALLQLKDEITIGMRSAIYKTSIIKSNDLLFDTNRKYGEDMVFVVKALLYSNKVISVNEILAFYVIWGNSVTQNVSLKHLDCYYSYIDLLNYVKKDNNLKEIENFLSEFKIQYSIAHVFSILGKDKNFHDDLFKFLNENDVKSYLKHYKIQKFDKNNIRYLIQCSGMRFCPKLLINVLNKMR